MDLQGTIAQMSGRARSTLSRAIDARALRGQMKELNNALTEDDAKVLYALLHSAQGMGGEISDDALVMASGGAGLAVKRNKIAMAIAGSKPIERLAADHIGRMLEMRLGGSEGLLDLKNTNDVILSQVAEDTL